MGRDGDPKARCFPPNVAGALQSPGGAPGIREATAPTDAAEMARRIAGSHLWLVASAPGVVACACEVGRKGGRWHDVGFWERGRP